MHDAHACGITRSLKKHAVAIIAIVQLMPSMRVAIIRNDPAPMNPVSAMAFRVRTSSPVNPLTNGVTKPQKSDPRPLKKQRKHRVGGALRGGEVVMLLEIRRQPGRDRSTSANERK